MSIASLKKGFRKMFLERIENESRFLEIDVHIGDKKKEHSFTDRDGQKVKFPKQLMAYKDYVNMVIDLKERKVVGWLPKFGAMHIKFDVRQHAQFWLKNEGNERFCLLNSHWNFWPLTTSLMTTGSGSTFVEYDVEENGTVLGLEYEYNLINFKLQGEFELTNADKEWIASQVDMKDTPIGDKTIREIPYNLDVTVYDADEEEIEYEEFDEYFVAMAYLKKQQQNPRAFHIHTYDNYGWNMIFDREVKEEYKDLYYSFDYIDQWIEEEKVEYVRRCILPDAEERGLYALRTT